MIQNDGFDVLRVRDEEERSARGGMVGGTGGLIIGIDNLGDPVNCDGELQTRQNIPMRPLVINSNSNNNNNSQNYGMNVSQNVLQNE